MIEFEEEYEGVLRLKVPFERIDTSVFLIEADAPILVDCATTAEDVDGVILPALKARGYTLSHLKTLVLTHSHGDHAGVDQYRCSIKLPEEYLKTLKRIQADGRIERILFSHAYEPWNRNRIEGRAEVLACLAECPNYLKNRRI